MVLESLYPTSLIRKNSLYAFLLGLAYSAIGIGAAVLIFPEDPAIVAVAFISFMMYPTIKTLLKENEEEESARELRTVMGFFIHHGKLFEIYLQFFLGVLIAFSFLSILLPNLATNYIFANQLDVLLGGKTGAAIFDAPLLASIIINNISVLILILIMALILGDGSIFLITWNASVWGTIFGNVAKNAALSVGNNPFIYFGLVLISVGPHMILETLAYFNAAIVGGISSHTLVRKDINKDKVKHTVKNIIFIMLIALIILAIAAIIEVYILKNTEVYRAIIKQAYQAIF